MQREQRDARSRDYYVECHKNQEEEESVLKDYKGELAKISEKINARAKNV